MSGRTDRGGSGRRRGPMSMRRGNLCVMNCTGVAAVLVMVLATAACDGSSDEPERAPAVATSGSSSPSGGETTPVDESTMEYVPEPGTIRTFPRGYPKVVPVSNLPAVVRSWYETDYDEAIAVAPGVWTPKLSHDGSPSRALRAQDVSIRGALGGSLRR
jgi:hypothetical protein